MRQISMHSMMKVGALTVDYKNSPSVWRTPRDGWHHAGLYVVCDFCVCVWGGVALLLAVLTMQRKSFLVKGQPSLSHLFGSQRL